MAIQNVLMLITVALLVPAWLAVMAVRRESDRAVSGPATWPYNWRYQDVAGRDVTADVTDRDIDVVRAMAIQADGAVLMDVRRDNTGWRVVGGLLGGSPLRRYATPGVALEDVAAQCRLITVEV